MNGVGFEMIGSTSVSFSPEGEGNLLEFYWHFPLYHNIVLIPPRRQWVKKLAFFAHFPFVGGMNFI